jgi:hypothetical protein
VQAQLQYEGALKLVPQSDMRIHALIELSLARLDYKARRNEDATKRAASAQSHFEKIGMRAEADEARKLVLTIAAGTS